MTKMIILDLDGTIFDTTARWNQCQQLYKNSKKDFWNCYQSEKYMDLDIPKQKVINYVQTLIDNETIIVVVSGRSVKQYSKTLSQLQSVNIIPQEIYLRHDKDYRKDYQFKADIISQLLQKHNAEEIIMIDDSDEVINYISSKFPNIKVIDAKTL
jgi:beta-phosphoglucomutase-like phosphatase (HAD superfamily)